MCIHWLIVCGIYIEKEQISTKTNWTLYRTDVIFRFWVDKAEHVLVLNFKNMQSIVAMHHNKNTFWMRLSVIKQFCCTKVHQKRIYQKHFCSQCSFSSVLFSLSLSHVACRKGAKASCIVALIAVYFTIIMVQNIVHVTRSVPTK